MSEIRPGPRYDQLAADTQITNVLFDVDDTLTKRDSKKGPSERFQRAVQRIGEQALNLNASLATGRPHPKTSHILDAIARADSRTAEGWSILSNGAQLYSGKTGQMAVEHVLSREATCGIARELQQQGIRHWLQDNGIDFTWQREVTARGDDLGAYAYPLDIWDPQGMAKVIAAYEPQKPLIFVAEGMTEEQLEHMKGVVNEESRGKAGVLVLGKREIAGVATYAAFLLDKRSNKKDALEILSEETGTPLEEIAMVGDGLNDLDPIRAAGIGVAMENGDQEVKDEAHLIAPPMEKDGAAIALEALAGFAKQVA